MNLIIGVQFSKDLHNNLIPKEIFVVAVRQDYIAHWLIAPPSPLKKLPKEARQQNKWLCKNCHGIFREDGDVSHERVEKNLRDIFKDCGKLYVRGREKVDFLQDLTTAEIINLEEDESCPSFPNLTWIGTYCLYHANKFGYLGYNCAVNNAAKLKNWMSKKGQNEQPGNSSVAVADSTTYDCGLSIGFDSEKMGQIHSPNFQHGQLKKPGSHWVTVYVNKKSRAFYFDSLGALPYSGPYRSLTRKFQNDQIQRPTTTE